MGKPLPVPVPLSNIAERLEPLQLFVVYLGRFVTAFHVALAKSFGCFEQCRSDARALGGNVLLLAWIQC
jgi:hypothetical protein